MANITIEDLIKSESQILNNIAEELNSEDDGRPSMSHSSHSSGHSSSSGHNSSTAKVERHLKKNTK